MQKVPNVNVIVCAENRTVYPPWSMHIASLQPKYTGTPRQARFIHVVPSLPSTLCFCSWHRAVSGFSADMGSSLL